MRKSMPSKKSIRAYWAKRLVALGKFDSVHHGWFLNDACFACRMLWSDNTPDGNTERCHILAHADGGTETVDNLHLLCYVCHKDSEYLSGKAYWKWFIKRLPSDGIISIVMQSVDGRRMLANQLRSKFNLLDPCNKQRI